MTSTRRRLNPLLVAPVVIAGGIAVGLLLVKYEENHWVPPAKWLGLGVFTAALFGLVFWEFRRNWTRVRFWATESAGRQLVGRLTGEGYEPELHERGTEWLVRVTQPEGLGSRELSEVETHLRTIADELSAEYDGWSAALE